MDKNKIYLPGLNGLRAIAALGVVASHINLNLEKFGLIKFKGLQLAGFGVTIFFTLSGFLITYLMLHEKQETGTIHIRKFYFRRILRIWPLYFFYLAIVVIYIGSISSNLMYYFFFIPNVAFVIHASYPLLVHYWSLGVEEQFYACWPWLLKYRNNLARFLICFILVFVFVKVCIKYLDGFQLISAFLHYSRFGCMAIGALAAVYFYTRNNVLHYLNSRYAEIAAWLIMVLITVNRFHIYSVIDNELVAIVTVILIFNQIKNENKIISLEHRIPDYLGKISFGLYVYNPLIIDLVARGFREFRVDAVWLQYGIIYLLTPSAIVLVAHFSYFWLEKRFLKFKGNYEVVSSRDSRINP